MTTEDDPKWRIFCVARIKPVGEGEAAAVVQESATQLSVPHPDDDDEEPTEGRLTFTMDAICGPEATQQDVYALFKPIVASTCKGRNGCVFAYGQTGSGKTHTVVGGDDFRSRGLVPRAIGQVFREAAKRRKKGGDVSVSCTFAQVYDDALYDLLDESNESDDVGEWTKASVLEGDDGSLTFEGLAEYGADEEEDALRLLWVGTARRVLGQTKANDASSRSHAVFTIYVVDAQRKTRAKLHLVDLAGSERFGAWSDGRRGTRARTSRLQRLRSRPRSGPDVWTSAPPSGALSHARSGTRARGAPAPKRRRSAPVPRRRRRRVRGVAEHQPEPPLPRAGRPGVAGRRRRAAPRALPQLRAHVHAPRLARRRAAKESEIPNFKGSFLGRFPLVSADFWTSDYLSERPRSVGAFPGTRARGTLTLKRR